MMVSPWLPRFSSASGRDAVLLGDESGGSVHLAELRLFDLARRVARHFREDDLSRTLVARKPEAEVVELLLPRWSATAGT